MRSLTYNGIEHRLTEHDWRKLLDRFDASRAKINFFGYYTIHVGSICMNRSYKCGQCPLRDPHKKTNSCTYMFMKIVGEEVFAHAYLLDSAVLWDPKFDLEVRQALQKVRDVLSTATKI